MTNPDDRPRWSFTWLLRIQRVGRNRPVDSPGDAPPVRTVWKILPWIVIGAGIVEIAVLVWIGVLPR